MTTNSQKQELTKWFSKLQQDIIAGLEALEDTFAPPSNSQKRFIRKEWHRCGNEDEGGGTMAILDGGSVFERAGVNVSTVYGALPADFSREIPGAQASPSFWASGISIVVHPRNPYVPIIHMNTRHIITTKSWFGGGIDLTPALAFAEDTDFFHTSLQKICDAHDPTYYENFKQQCDEYFYLPHRQEPRGAGGIFYDNLNSGSFAEDFAFTKSVGCAFLEIYSAIVQRRVQTSWDDHARSTQLLKRGRYVEFNLLYDRGTRFGLQTGGNTEAILMSLPPLAQWR
ncbi:MAG: oxygen-dependent coproporphyrinogen oxidase [Alphaproteobacteria bacterium]